MNAYKIKKSYATAICRDCINANFVERSEKKKIESKHRIWNNSVDNCVNYS